jgi:hypothetical protein
MRCRKARHRLATCYNRRLSAPWRFQSVGTRRVVLSLKECSSTGRAPVSKCDFVRPDGYYHVLKRGGWPRVSGSSSRPSFVLIPARAAMFVGKTVGRCS